MSDQTTAYDDAARQAPTVRVRAWDLPTRLCKWSLTILVLVAWISSGFNDPTMVVHKAAGYGIIILLIFRLLWGLFGGSTARFNNFMRSPAEVRAYLRSLWAGQPRIYLGHNPAGGLVVVAILLICAVQVGLGLFSSDGVLASGPFAGVVGETMASWAAKLHAAWFYFVVLGFLALHVVANLYYQFFKRENLIGAMISGHKEERAYADDVELRGGSPLVALACLTVAIALVYIGMTASDASLFTSP